MTNIRSLGSKRARVGLFASMLVFALGACDDGSVNPVLERAELVILDRKEVRLVSLGEELKPTVQVLSNEGRVMSDVSLTWTVEDPKILEPLPNGTFKALANGTTRVTVHASNGETGVSAESYRAGAGPSETVVVSVQQMPAALMLNPVSKKFFAIGQKTYMTATVTDARGNPMAVPPTITWSSEDGSVATVNELGRVTAVSDGTARIVATSGALTGTALAEVSATVPYTACFTFVLQGSVNSGQTVCASTKLTVREQGG